MLFRGSSPQAYINTRLRVCQSLRRGNPLRREIKCEAYVHADSALDATGRGGGMASGGTGWGGSWVRPPPCRTALPFLPSAGGGPPFPATAGTGRIRVLVGGGLQPRLAAAAARIVATRSSLPPFAPRAAAAAHLALRRSGLRAASARARRLRPGVRIAGEFLPWRAPPLRPRGAPAAAAAVTGRSARDASRTSRPVQKTPLRGAQRLTEAFTVSVGLVSGLVTRA